VLQQPAQGPQVGVTQVPAEQVRLVTLQLKQGTPPVPHAVADCPLWHWLLETHPVQQAVLRQVPTVGPTLQRNPSGAGCVVQLPWEQVPAWQALVLGQGTQALPPLPHWVAPWVVRGTHWPAAQQPTQVAGEQPASESGPSGAGPPSAMGMTASAGLLSAGRASGLDPRSIASDCAA